MKYLNRSEILEEAKRCVCGKRQEDYGQPEDSFSIIGKFWSTYLDKEITARDVAAMMALLKLARIKKGVKVDSSIDLAGYAACLGEIDGEKL